MPGELELAELSSYAVEARYDFEFWPDLRTTREAARLALEGPARCPALRTRPTGASLKKPVPGVLRSGALQGGILDLPG